VMSHAFKYREVGRSRRGFPMDTKQSQSSHKWYEGSMWEGALFIRKKKKKNITGKVIIMSLELVGTDGNEVSGGKRFGEVRHKKGHHGDVERKDGLNTVSHEEG
jgi:hypothetical protein